MKKTNKRAFTLVELLVVITIIAVLAAIAYSSYRSSVARSKRSEVAPCISEAVNRLENYRANHGVYPTSNVWDAIKLDPDCSEHYAGAISVTNGGENFIVAYSDTNKQIWSGTVNDTWVQTDRSGRQIHVSNPIDPSNAESVPSGYSLP